MNGQFLAKFCFGPLISAHLISVCPDQHKRDTPDSANRAFYPYSREKKTSGGVIFQLDIHASKSCTCCCACEWLVSGLDHVHDY
jgi:hypothetical protein